MVGWIKLHRSIMNWDWYKDAVAPRVYFHIILNANHEDKKWMGRTIKIGQHVGSSDTIAEALGLSRQNVRTAINKLKSTNNLTIESTSKFTIYTVVNYEKYQQVEEDVTSTLTSTLTNNQPATNQQLTTPKELKNLRIKEKNISPPKNSSALPPDDFSLAPLVPVQEVDDRFDRFWEAYPRKIGKKEARAKFTAMLKAGARFEEILRGAENFAITRIGEDSNYTAHPTTWLHNERWHDYQTPRTAPKPLSPLQEHENFMKRLTTGAY